MYNLFVVMNSAYFDHGKLLLLSVSKNLNLAMIGKVIVQDNGLTKKQRAILSSVCPVVTYMDVGVHEPDGESWSREWHTNVASKTRGVVKCLCGGVHPLVMIDADCVILRDFSFLLDNSYDVQIIKRKNKTPYLASFVVFNNSDGALDLVRSWVRLIESTPLTSSRKPKFPYKAKESRLFAPALRSLSGKVSVGNLNVDSLSCAPSVFLDHVSRRGKWNSRHVVLHFKGGREEQSLNFFLSEYKRRFGKDFLDLFR